MPRILVTVDRGHASSIRQPVYLDERVDALHLDDEHSAEQFIERLAWAIQDAETAEAATAS